MTDILKMSARKYWRKLFRADHAVSSSFQGPKYSIVPKERIAELVEIQGKNRKAPRV